MFFDQAFGIQLFIPTVKENLLQLEEALKITVSNRLTAKIKLAVNLRVHAIKTLIWAYLQGGNYEDALHLSLNAASQYEGDQSLSKELLFLKIVSEMVGNLKCGETTEELLSSAILNCSADQGSIRKYKVCNYY